MVRPGAAAAAALDPCHFTSFIGYEWTNNCTGDGGSAATCHKNVIFGDTNVPVAPFDSLSNPTQESLWSALDHGCNGGRGSPCGCTRPGTRPPTSAPTRASRRRSSHQSSRLGSDGSRVASTARARPPASTVTTSTAWRSSTSRLG
ncbi:MAG TPA: DUF3604 domain-containing protein [Kofleriaceae bacterium]